MGAGSKGDAFRDSGLTSAEPGQLKLQAEDVQPTRIPEEDPNFGTLSCCLGTWLPQGTVAPCPAAQSLGREAENLVMTLTLGHKVEGLKRTQG